MITIPFYFRFVNNHERQKRDSAKNRCKISYIRYNSTPMPLFIRYVRSDSLVFCSLPDLIFIVILPPSATLILNTKQSLSIIPCFDRGSIFPTCTSNLMFPKTFCCPHFHHFFHFFIFVYCLCSLNYCMHSITPSLNDALQIFGAAFLFPFDAKAFH